MATALAQPLASPCLSNPKRQLGLRSLFTNIFKENGNASKLLHSGLVPHFSLIAPQLGPRPQSPSPSQFNRQTCFIMQGFYFLSTQ